MQQFANNQGSNLPARTILRRPAVEERIGAAINETATSTHRFMLLLAKLGIPHVVLFDDDNNDKHHEKLNALINSSAHTEFTLGFVPIKGNLETFLEMPNSDRRQKPLHSLWSYEQNAFNAEKLDQLCKALQSYL